MAEIPESFTPHDGSGMPEGVGPDDRVDVVLCNGRIYRGFIAKFWEVGGDDYWDTFRDCYCIIAYRLHVPEPPKPDIAEILAEALEKAGSTFQYYGDLHKAKGTKEADQKAAYNYALAMDMEEALQQYRDSRND